MRRPTEVADRGGPERCWYTRHGAFEGGGVVGMGEQA